MGTQIPIYEQLLAITKGLNRRFPDGNEPYQTITRLLEECGELAREVNHFEDSGVKRAKYREPQAASLAREIRQVLQCVLGIAQYYKVEDELATSIEQYYLRLQAEGWIE